MNRKPRKGDLYLISTKPAGNYSGPRLTFSSPSLPILSPVAVEPQFLQLEHTFFLAAQIRNSTPYPGLAARRMSPPKLFLCIPHKLLSSEIGST